MSIIYTSLEGFGTLQRVFAIHTSLCPVSPPGRTADAQDWRRGDEDSVSSLFQAVICVALCRQVQLILLVLRTGQKLYSLSTVLIN